MLLCPWSLIALFTRRRILRSENVAQERTALKVMKRKNTGMETERQVLLYRKHSLVDFGPHRMPASLVRVWLGHSMQDNGFTPKQIDTE